MSAVNAINWFEIPVADFDRAVKFYSTIMGVELQLWEMGPARMAVFSVDRGAVSGALVSQPNHQPGPHGARIYLNASGKFDDVLARVDTAGGRILEPKALVTEEIGYTALFADTEGNHVAIHGAK